MIKQITVGVQRVINLGNYENVRYECSVVVEVEEGISAHDTYQASLQFCKDNVLAEITRIEASKEEARLANRKGTC